MDKKTIAGIGVAIVAFTGATFINVKAPENIGAVSETTLSLIPDKPSYAVGQNFSVKVDLQSASSSVATDVLLTYDPTMITFNDPPLLPSPYTLRVGDVEEDSFRFSVLGDNLTGTLATMYFKALKAGTTTIHLIHTVGTTTDSNVSFEGNDILQVTNDAQITIQAKTGK